MGSGGQAHLRPTRTGGWSRTISARLMRAPGFQSSPAWHVPPRGLEPPKPAFVALAAIHSPGAWAWPPVRDLNPLFRDESAASLPARRTGDGGAHGFRSRLSALKERRPRQKSSAPGERRAEE